MREPSWNLCVDEAGGRRGGKWLSGQTSRGAKVYPEYLPRGYSDKGIQLLLLPVVCMGVCLARLPLLKDRHLLPQASGEGMMVPAEVLFRNMFVELR